MIPCFVCKRNVPEKRITYRARQFGKGLCSDRCSKIMYSTYGAPIPNSLGIKQFDDKRKIFVKRQKLKLKMLRGELKRKKLPL